MQIWVDADACPKVIKDILVRASQRTHIALTFVANKPMQVPSSSHINAVQVNSGFDVADNYIVQNLTAGDLVVTADIPLAADAIERGANALNPRGIFYSKENIKEKLVMRDFMDQLRGSGIQTGGPNALSQSDRKMFADQLDRFLTKRPAS